MDDVPPRWRCLDIFYRITKMSTRPNHRPVLLSSAKQSTAALPVRQHATLDFDHQAVKRRIRQVGMDVLAVTALSNGTGVKYTLLGGAVVTVYNNGNHQLQGKVSDDDRERLALALGSR
jgi:hypothetical protein